MMKHTAHLGKHLKSQKSRCEETERVEVVTGHNFYLNIFGIYKSIYEQHFASADVVLCLFTN